MTDRETLLRAAELLRQHYGGCAWENWYPGCLSCVAEMAARIAEECAEDFDE